MNIKTDLPRGVRVVEHTWIPMSDGTRLAARLWLPDDASDLRPVPAIFECHPYRKSDCMGVTDDWSATGDEMRYAYFAGHGYACVHMDLRGSGDSEGILYDEYLPQEQLDAVEAIAWIAAQPWCTGAVGMMGGSWSGFNSLQVAARRPPALKAIITLYSTDDRYADDVHYAGGCLLSGYMLLWASTMLAFNARPPHPHVVGDRWREMWLERLEKTPPYVEAWVTHQRRDEFWKQGSVCENYADITCAVYAVGGWADGYRNTVFRLLEGLTCPRKGLVGPWGHVYPHHGSPGPEIGFLQECLRWWDHWLKGVDMGIMEEPALRVWMQQSVAPNPTHAERPGRWVAERTWPPHRPDGPAGPGSPHISPVTYFLNAPGALAETPGRAVALTIRGAQAAGLQAGTWCSFGHPGDFAPDQRAEDGLSLCFDSAAAAQPVEILGYPEVTLTLAADRPNALLAVRLCDIAPDGTSLLVTRGLLNLTHRESHEAPVPLDPGRRYTVTLRLNSMAHSLPVGHRWRVAISPNYWYHAWPSPEAVTLTLFAGDGCQLRLPVRAPREEDAHLRPFGPAEGAAPLAMEIRRAGSRRINIEHDAIAGRFRLTERVDEGLIRQAANGIEFDSVSLDEYSIVEGQPLSASNRCERSITISRGEWRTRVETVSTMTGDDRHFHLTNTLDAYEGEARIFAKSWHLRVPRDLV